MSLIRYVFLASLVTGCAASELDGPLDLEITGGFGGEQILLHLELDGSYSINSRLDPPSSGVLDPAEMDQVRDAIADADLTWLRPRVFSCADFPCGADAYVQRLQAQVSGKVVEVRVDRNISDDHLPSDLVRALDLLETIARR